MTIMTAPMSATHHVSGASEADQPYWGDLVKWRTAQSALRGAVEISHHFIGGMLPKVDASGRVVEADGLCLRCGSVLLVDFGAGGPFISGKARREHCIPRDRWWADAGAEARITRRAFGARSDPAFVGYALAVYARAQQAHDAGVDLARALGLPGDQNTRATLDRLALYPLPGGEATATQRPVQEMARACRIDGALLTRVLDEARAAVAAEEGQRAVVAHEGAIVSVRQDLARLDHERAAVQERLDGLLAHGKE